MLNVELRDSVVVVEGRPYSVQELYVGGKIKGFVKARRETGFSGLLVVEPYKVFYEYPGMLLVGDPVKPAENKLALSEDRRGFTVRVGGRVYTGLYEVSVRLEDVYAGFAVLYYPRRLTLSTGDAALSHREGFAFLEVVFKPREGVAEARVARGVVE